MKEKPRSSALKGVINFNGAEIILHHLDKSDLTTPKVILDLSRVDRFSDVGRRMVLEGMRRLAMDGLCIGLFDPEGRLPEPDIGDGTLPFLVSSSPLTGRRPA